MIATSRQSASRAIVPAIREGLRHPLPAQARLAGTARVNLHQHSPGAFSLVREHRNEHRPSGIVNGLRQHPTGESLDIQVLDRDQAVLVDQPARQLVLEIRPLVAHVDVGALEQQHRLAPPAATLLTPRHLPLAAPQPGFRVPVVPGILDLRPIGKHGETASKTH